MMGPNKRQIRQFATFADFLGATKLNLFNRKCLAGCQEHKLNRLRSCKRRRCCGRRCHPRRRCRCYCRGHCRCRCHRRRRHRRRRRRCRCPRRRCSRRRCHPRRQRLNLLRKFCSSYRILTKTCISGSCLSDNQLHLSLF